MFLRTAIALVVLALPAAAAERVGDPPTLTTAEAVRGLTPARAGEARAVKLAGVVTHTAAPGGGFFLQDSTAGVLVRPKGDAVDLRPGDRVEVDGTAEPGDFVPFVAAAAVCKLGAGELPRAEPYGLAAGESRRLHGHRVRAWGVVRNARSEGGSTFVDVFAAGGSAVLVLPGEHWTLPARKIRHEAVVVEGVCVAAVEDRRVAGPPTILVSELPPVEPPVPVEPRPIGRLADYSPRPGEQRARVRGVVTAAPLPNMLVVQDDTGGAAVWTDNPTGFSAGAAVEACGVLRVEGRRLALTRARVTPAPGPGKAELPAPVASSATELEKGARDSLRVRVEGRVESVRAVEGWTALALRADGVAVEVFVPGAPDAGGLGGKLGARVSVVGVVADVRPDRRPPIAPGVYALDADAVAVLEPAPPADALAAAAAPWFTPARAAYMLGGAAAALFLGGGGWVVALRGRARRAAEEARRAAEEKTRLERQMRQASKLEAVGRLAGGIAHDFNNLLTVINGCAELLAEQAARDGIPPSGLTDDIRRAGERAAALTGQLLAFTRKRDAVVGPVNLNDVVADTARLLRRVIGEDIRVELAPAADLPPVRGEAGLLHQVMMNLAVNAKDAMPDGGVLTLSTALVAGPGAGGESVRQLVRLTVADTGVGMSDEVKARLFEPFFTTKAVGSGTGLGLATVASIVEKLRGRVGVESAPGRGTRFHIDLRVHGEPVSDAEFALPTPFPPVRAVRGRALAGAAVLVVEDDEMVRGTIAAGLRGEGATVFCANHPDDALRLLATHAGRVDVLVADVVMPGMSGPALAERTRESRPEMRVVYISGHTADEVARLGVREDEVEFLQKPFTPDSLARRLLRVLARDGATA